MGKTASQYAASELHTRIMVCSGRMNVFQPSRQAVPSAAPIYDGTHRQAAGFRKIACSSCAGSARSIRKP